MKQVKLSAVERSETGRGPARRLRASGRIPAVIYGKSGVRPLTLVESEFRILMRKTAGAAAVIEINDDKGGKTLSVIQETERHPISHNFVHVDFHEVSANEAMNAVLPVHHHGEPIGVKVGNGTLEVHHHEVAIRCLPKDLPEFIDVDVSELNVGDTITIGDLKAIDGVSFTEDTDKVLITVTAAKVMAEETPATAAAEVAPAPVKAG